MHVFCGLRNVITSLGILLGTLNFKRVIYPWGHNNPSCHLIYWFSTLNITILASFYSSRHLGHLNIIFCFSDTSHKDWVIGTCFIRTLSNSKYHKNWLLLWLFSILFLLSSFFCFHSDYSIIFNLSIKLDLFNDSGPLLVSECCSFSSKSNSSSVSALLPFSWTCLLGFF